MYETMFPAVASLSKMYLWCGANIYALIGLNEGFNQSDVPLDKQLKVNITLTEAEAKKLIAVFPDMWVSGPGADRLRGE